MPDNDGDCKFYQDGNLTVFETPSPYFNNMRCIQNVTCSDPNHSVHYEFEYFDTESSYDQLYVNGLVYQGYYVPTYEWMDSFTTRVDLVFTSDGSYTRRGFKMNLKCDISTPTTTTTTTSTTTTTAVINEECIFEEYDDGAIFDTGEPYLNRMRIGIHI